ncbi:MAG: ATP-binding protein [Chitinispirillales bacterium]|jgi:hypothetical protein|nr:ATP-binding protein [Chitinispirillales bacterium]
MDETERKKPLPVGQSFFDRVVEDGSYYVDKTLFIKDLLDRNITVTLCTRPRRFGKTLNQTMLKCFFEDNAPLPVPGGGARKDTRTLFNGLKIEAAGERYLEHQGRYPVIFLSFKEGKMANFESSYRMLKDELAKEFDRHRYACEKISSVKKQALFEKLADGEGSSGDYSKSLLFLCECLENYHGKKAIILIDEYDVPLENSWTRDFYQEMTDFIRPLMSSTFKDNPCLQFAVITGCLRVSKESIFTGLNNLDTASVLNNAYSAYFGFTQDEVDVMLNYYGLDAKKRIVRDWYNGYLFGNTEVYNPWSCLKSISSWIDDVNEYPQPYWVNTSGNDLIRDIIGKMNAEAKAGLETLMAGGTISAAVDEYVTYGDLFNNADNIWNFLLFTGYLKKAGKSVDSWERIVVEAKIPNKEVNIIFDTKIREWFEGYIKEKDRKELFNAILSGDTETVESELSEILVEYVSYMHSVESNYHSFTNGVLSGLAGYTVTSEGESGEGRCDLVLHSRVAGKNGKAVIFEFKVAAKEDGLETACEKAMKQIEEKRYAAKWESNGYKNIIKYGLGFYKKRCKVMKGETGKES